MQELCISFTYLTESLDFFYIIFDSKCNISHISHMYYLFKTKVGLFDICNQNLLSFHNLKKVKNKINKHYLIYICTVNSIFSYPPILALESLLHIGFETKSM